MRNALSLPAMANFAAAIEHAHAMPDLLALIVTGAGKAFISGGDPHLQAHPANCAQLMRRGQCH